MYQIGGTCKGCDMGGHGAIMGVMHGGGETPLSAVRPCRAPFLEECPQHHGHKGDPGVTPGTWRHW